MLAARRVDLAIAAAKARLDLAAGRAPVAGNLVPVVALLAAADDAVPADRRLAASAFVMGARVEALRVVRQIAILPRITHAVAAGGQIDAADAGGADQRVGSRRREGEAEPSIVPARKYHALQLDQVDVASALVLRVPTGNEDDFQGTGSVELEPLLIASTPPLAPIRWPRLRGYANGGVNLDTEDVDGSEGRWGIGMDWLAGDGFTAAVALLARHAFRRIEPAGFLDVERRDPKTRRTFLAPLFGIRDRRPDFYDLSVGCRVNLWRNTVIGFVNAIVPLNRDGFRADVIPLAGIEATF